MHVVASLDHGGLERLVVDWTNARNRRYPDSTHICYLGRPGGLVGEADVQANLSIVLRASRAAQDFARGCFNEKETTMVCQPKEVAECVEECFGLVGWHESTIDAMTVVDI